MGAGKNWREESKGKSVDAYTYGLTVEMYPETWDQLLAWCRAANSEVGGTFLVKQEGERFIVGDVFLPEQECSAGSTEATTDGLVKIITDLHKRDPKLLPQHFGWWHTHYNFSAYWSSVDDDNIDRLVDDGQNLRLSIVLNQMGEYVARLDFKSPIRMTIDNIPITFIHAETYNRKKAKKEVDAAVTLWVPKPKGEAGFNFMKFPTREKMTKKDRKRLKRLLEKQAIASKDANDKGGGIIQSVWCHKELSWVDPRQGWLDDKQIWHDAILVNT